MRHASAAPLPQQPGFTLIELMITVAIVGILAAIALPIYSGQVRKGVRRAAQAQMLDLAIREQQSLLADRAFATYPGLSAAGYVLPLELTAKYQPWISTGSGTVPAFTITFAATGAQAPDGDLTLTSEGVKSPASKW